MFKHFKKSKEILVVIVFFLSYMLFSLISLFIDPEQQQTSIIILFVMMMASSLIVAWLFKDRLLQDLSFFKLNYKSYLIKIIVGLVLMIGFVYVHDVILNLLVTLESSEPVAEAHVDVVMILSMITLVIFTPILEESTFRGSIFNLLNDKLGVVLSLVILNLFFAVMHVLGGSFMFMPFYFVLGTLLTLTYLYTKQNLVAVMLLHLLFNLFFLI